MLPERRATGLAFDPEADTLRIDAEGAQGAASERSAQLLLDARGFLVGVDVEGPPRPGGRVVVMLGPHEAVERVVPARVLVHGDGAQVVVRGARRAVRGHEKNPYL
jgi:hypothetical protein